MQKIIFITPEDAELGFKLTGVSQYTADEGNIIAILKSAVTEPDTGLVIADERLINSSNDEKLREIEHSWHGILLILPSPERPRAEIEDYASRLIRRAIGYHVRLKI
jgi:V/A-type H+-transporting ATPase subunit F